VGQVYGCMAEAMVLGFEKSPGMSFTGSLSLKRIDYVDSRAERHGFGLSQVDLGTAASKLRTQLHVHAG
jgi:predicted amino acid dehydrogenase